MTSWSRAAFTGGSVAVLLSMAGAGVFPAQARTLGIEERVAFERTMEQLRWQHRIWPDQNPRPKPDFDSVMPAGRLRERVEDSLRKGQALEQVWNRRISREELEAELARIVAQTKDPGRLGELFAALGGDPEAVLECLVRPLVTERLIRGA